MGISASVLIYTQAYNTKSFLPECIESVLHQTYSDFEYILIDNGSTDGSKEILEQYAAQDSRIRLIRFETNRLGIGLQMALETASGKYIANIDSDDWWEPNYLESLINFMEENHLDLAVTGTVNYFEETKVSRVMRKLDTPLVLSRRQFAEHYPQLWMYPSTNWANIMRTELFKQSSLLEMSTLNLSNGSDTVFMLKYMAHCERIGIDNTALYHYRIRVKQASRQYNPRRFDSNVYCTEEICRFLEMHDTFDQPKQEWLKLVYINLTKTTLHLLSESVLTADEKIAECARIVSNPLTSAALTHVCGEREQWLRSVWGIALKAAENRAFTNTESLETILSALAPRCGAALSKDTVSLFMREPELMAALQQDDPDALVKHLLHLIAAKRYTKQYDLGQMLQTLAQDKPLLQGISSVGFLRKYHNIYWMIWQEQTLEALDVMTGLLLENRVQSAEEDFLQLYLSIAAMLEQVPAFLFGKTCLARFYSRQRRAEDCKAIIKELETMGVEDNEDLSEIRKQLALLERAQ